MGPPAAAQRVLHVLAAGLDLTVSVVPVWDRNVQSANGMSFKLVRG